MPNAFRLCVASLSLFAFLSAPLFTTINVHAAGDNPDPSSFWPSLQERETLFGDWGGLRPRAEEYGLRWDLVYTGEFFQNLRGGLNTHDAGEYRGLVDFLLELDTAEAGWWEGGSFFLHIQEGHGRGITDDHVGDFQTLSNIDADDFFQISEIGYRHSFLDDRLWLKLGKMEANDDFAGMEYGAEFLNSSGGYTPTIPLVTYPDQDWGFVLGTQPVSWFSLNLGVYQGDPDGGRSIGSTLDNLRGPMLMVEPSFHYSLSGFPGRISLGGWWNGTQTERFDPEALERRFCKDSHGEYLTWEQQVWKETADEDDSQGVGLFFQIGNARHDRSEADESYSAGFQWTGALPGRDADIWGLGMFRVDFSERAEFGDDHETAYELFYKYQALPWLTFKPDLQYITSPGGGDTQDALAVGLRWEVFF